MRIFFTAILVSLLASACSSVSVDEYSRGKPTMDPAAFFVGELTAHGVVLDRSGRVIRSFNADIVASWADGVGTLDEDFVFDDGEQQTRVWTLTPDGTGGYIGTAGDVVGEGQLSWSGNALFMDYVLRIPWRDGTVDVRVDDRMYRVSEDVLINESRMQKFGVTVGRILLTIVRQPGSA